VSEEWNKGDGDDFFNPKLEKGLGVLMRPGRINPELARDWFWEYNIFN